MEEVMGGRRMFWERGGYGSGDYKWVEYGQSMLLSNWFSFRLVTLACHDV